MRWRWGWWRLVVLVVGVAHATVHDARGATYVVDSAGDLPDADPGDALCATTSGTCTLRAAMEQANAVAGEPHTIALPAGYYYAPSATLPNVVQDVTILGGSGGSVIESPHPAHPRLFEVAAGGRLALHDVELASAQVGPGSAVRASGGDVVLVRCWIYLNHGGAVSVAAPSPLATPATIGVTDTHFVQNTGGTALEVGTSYSLVVDGSTFQDNLATGDLGGAIAVTGTGTGRTHSIADSTFVGNVADGGGALAILDASGPFSITRSTFTGNIGASYEAPLCGGGAILSVDPAVTVTESSFIDNRANAPTCNGGAILSPQAPFTCTGSTFKGNASYAAGGAVSATGVTLVNSTFWGNGAGTSGGAIHVDDPSQPDALRAANVTIANNSANAGGGIAGGSENVVVKNTILAGNYAGSGSDCLGTVASQGYNLVVDDDAGCDFLATTGDRVGTDATSLNLLIWGPWDNGGPTPTCELAPGSDGIDMGNPAGCTDFDGTPLATDQRGIARPIDGDGVGGAICDIGAFEATTTTTITSTTSSTLPVPVCNDGVAIDRPVLTVKHVLPPSGDEGFTFRGSLLFPPGTPASFDPATTGVQILLEDLSTSTAIFDLSHRTTAVPGGAGCGARDGWERTRYTNLTGAIDPPACTPGSAKGLRSVRFRDRRAAGKGIAFTVVAKNAPLGVPVGPFRGTVVVGASAATSLAGDCGAHAFAADACRGRGTSIRCR